PAPTSSPLLPYTTLFRSKAALAAPKRSRGARKSRGGRTALREYRCVSALASDRRCPGRRACDGRYEREPHAAPQHKNARLGRKADRKSTRLNSSHLVISY